MIVQAVWGVVLFVFFIVVIFKARRRRSTRTLTPGPGAMGAVYDLLNQDRRNAVEIIVEEKAEARDPEDADGNLPDLERPRK
ncbi:MAG TPA: hypothetical protein VH138_06645 [Vicinamibacterales bacterium]|nr:hypothetical protein [Vicinamibacterales bacterium]